MLLQLHSPQHVKKGYEDRHLQNKGETRPERTNLVLLVELHHLLIQGLFIALVLLLELLDLRLQLLHGPHALELPDRQWNKEDPHDNGQDDNRPSPAERQFLVYGNCLSAGDGLLSS